MKRQWGLIAKIIGSCHLTFSVQQLHFWCNFIISLKILQTSELVISPFVTCWKLRVWEGTEEILSPWSKLLNLQALFDYKGLESHCEFGIMCNFPRSTKRYLDLDEQRVALLYLRSTARYSAQHSSDFGQQWRKQTRHDWKTCNMENPRFVSELENESHEN